MTTDILIVYEVRGSRDIECRNGGILHLERLAIGLHVTVGFHQHLTVCFQSRLYAFLFHTFDGGRQQVHLSVAAFYYGSYDLRLQLAGEGDSEGECPFLVGLDADDDDIIGL